MPKAATPSAARRLEDIPNIGKAIAGDLRIVGIASPADLRGCDALALYHALNKKTGKRHDPCVLDTFMAAVAFMNGRGAKPWWTFTPQRKKMLTKAGT